MRNEVSTLQMGSVRSAASNDDSSLLFLLLWQWRRRTEMRGHPFSRALFLFWRPIFKTLASCFFGNREEERNVNLVCVRDLVGMRHAPPHARPPQHQPFSLVAPSFRFFSLHPLWRGGQPEPCLSPLLHIFHRIWLKSTGIVASYPRRAECGKSDSDCYFHAAKGSPAVVPYPSIYRNTLGTFCTMAMPL